MRMSTESQSEESASAPADWLAAYAITGMERFGSSQELNRVDGTLVIGDSADVNAILKRCSNTWPPEKHLLFFLLLFGQYGARS